MTEPHTFVITEEMEEFAQSLAREAADLHRLKEKQQSETGVYWSRVFNNEAPPMPNNQMGWTSVCVKDECDRYRAFARDLRDVTQVANPHMFCRSEPSAECIREMNKLVSDQAREHGIKLPEAVTFFGDRAIG